MSDTVVLSKQPLCLTVDPSSEFIDAGYAYAAKRAAEGGASAKRLGELVVHVGSTVNPQGKLHGSTTFQYIDLAEVDEVLGAIMTYRELPGLLIGSSKARFSQRDILFAKIRPSIDNKKVAYVYQELENAVASTEFIVLRVKPGVNPLFVFSALRSNEFTQAVIRECGGDTGRQRINPSKLLGIPVAWPEKDLREDISSHAAAYFKALEATMALRQQSLDISQEAFGPTTMRTATPRRARTKTE